MMHQSRRPLGAIALVLGLAAMACCTASARVTCEGHQLLSTPRAAESSEGIKPCTSRSPDGALTAFVLPADSSLNVTPDMESRIEIRTQGGQVHALKDYLSPRDANGYYIEQAKWTRDAQFFVNSLSSSGGHSPWSSPMAVYGRERNDFINFSDMIDGNPTLSASFKMTGERITVDLRDALAKRPAAQ
jgi:hypothetical protein